MRIVYRIAAIEHQTTFNTDTAAGQARASEFVADLIACRVCFSVDYCQHQPAPAASTRSSQRQPNAPQWC